MQYRIFKPRRTLRSSAKSGANKNIVLEDGELMVVRKGPDNEYNKGVKSDIYIGNGVTKLEQMKPAVYGDTSEEPIDVSLDSSTTSQEALSKVVSGKTLSALIGALKKAIETVKYEAIVPVFTGPSSSSSGTSGLVPAPAENTMNYVLSASGWVAKATNATNADKATSATKDSANQQINTTYIKGISVNGTTMTVTKGNGSASTVALQDQNTQYPLAIKSVSANQTTLTFTHYNNNTSTVATKDTTYNVMGYASPTAAGSVGLVPQPARGQENYVLTGSGWKKSAGDASSSEWADEAGTSNYLGGLNSTTENAILDDILIDFGYEG